MKQLNFFGTIWKSWWEEYISNLFISFWLWNCWTKHYLSSIRYWLGNHVRIFFKKWNQTRKKRLMPQREKFIQKGRHLYSSRSIWTKRTKRYDWALLPLKIGPSGQVDIIQMNFIVKFEYLLFFVLIIDSGFRFHSSGARFRNTLKKQKTCEHIHCAWIVLKKLSWVDHLSTALENEWFLRSNSFSHYVDRFLVFHDLICSGRPIEVS